MKTLLLLSILATSFLAALSAQAAFEKEFYQTLAKSRSEDLRESGLLATEVLIAEGMMDLQMDYYAASKNPALQKFIDQTILKIFKTTNGVVLCAALGSDAANLSSQLGISTATATAVSRLCQQAFPKLPLVENLQRMGRKEFYFVTNVPKATPFNSWTSMTNGTFIFFEEQLSEEEIAARIIHELIIGFDSKLQVSSQTLIPIAEDFGYKVSSGSFSNLKDEIRRTAGAIPLPALRFALASIRAMAAERVMINEIFGVHAEYKLKNQEIFTLIKSNQLEKAFLKVTDALLPLQVYLLPPEYLVVPVKERAAEVPSLILVPEQAHELISDISGSSIQLKSNSRTQSLLEWLATPAIGQHAFFFARGPRPRIGDGWSEAEHHERRDVLDFLRSEADRQGLHRLETKGSLDDGQRLMLMQQMMRALGR